MTRKKQGAPQRLNSQNEVDYPLHKCDSDLPQDEDLNNKIITHNLSSSEHLIADKDSTVTKTEYNREAEDEKTPQNFNSDVVSTEPTNTMDSSCQKLLAFTKNFLENDHINNNLPKIKQERVLVDNTIQSNNSSTTSHFYPKSPDACIAASQQDRNQSPIRDLSFNKEKGSKVSTMNSTTMLEKISDIVEHSAMSPNSTSKTKSGDLIHETTTFPHDNDMDGLDAMTDAASLNAAQKFLMNAMLRQQKQFYEQCTNNWMNVQRSDNNCLSKSKAERYRWCVHGNDTNQKLPRSSTSSQSHVSNLKKSANMAGNGVTPVQDKLYSTVFTGASKFHCRDCGNPFNTLVELTVHMNKTGHFRDANGADKMKAAEEHSQANVTKTKKRTIAEDDLQSEKVLTCMGCGHLFESLQDLSVHMIKTKHYENVPSLRMWSQKQEVASEPLPGSRKKSVNNSMSYPNRRTDASSISGLEPSVFTRSSMYPSSLLAGMNNAAAYASLMSPWLAFPPACLPSLIAGASALPYSLGFQSGMFPGAFMQPPVTMATPDEKPTNLKCSHCRETFSSMQHLIEHVHETSHFPNLDTSSMIPGFPFMPHIAAASVNLNTSSKSSPPLQLNSVNAVSNISKQNSSSNSSPVSSVGNRSSTPPSGSDVDRNNYFRNSHKERKDEQENSCGFDFIKSLESTIQTAISKVESPHGEKQTYRKSSATHENHYKTTFTPFMSSIRSDKVVKSTPASLNETSDKRTRYSSDNSSNSSVRHSDIDDKSCSSLRKPFHTNTCRANRELSKTTGEKKDDRPLDLTIKKVDRRHSDSHSPKLSSVNASATSPSTSEKSIGAVFPKSNVTISNDNHASQPDSNPARSTLDVFSVYSGGQPQTNPLKSLHDNMQSFFSYMKPKIEAAISLSGSNSAMLQDSQPCVQSKPPPAAYMPLMMANNTSDVGSNPLKEILKIVNNTDMEKCRSAVPDAKPREQNHASRKRSSLSDYSPIDPKKSKISVLLQDLVNPKDEGTSVNGNPLQMMQDLVDNKLNRSSGRNAHKLKHSENNSSYSVQTKSPTSSLPSSSTVASSMSDKADIFPPTMNSVTSVANALLSLKSSIVKNSFKSATKANGFASPSLLSPNTSERKPHSTDESDQHTHSMSDQELMLSVAFARLMSHTSSSRHQALHISDADVSILSRRVGLTCEKVKAWLGKAHSELKSRGRFSFVHFNDENICKPIELICTKCQSDRRFTSLDEFEVHVQRHIEQSSTKTTNSTDANSVVCGQYRRHSDVTSDDLSMTSRDEMNGKPLNEKITYQGALCFGRYPPGQLDQYHVTSDVTSSQRENGLSPHVDVTTTSPTQNEVIPLKRLRHHSHRRCADEVAASDDVISVTS